MYAPSPAHSPPHSVGTVGHAVMVLNVIGLPRAALNARMIDLDTLPMWVCAFAKSTAVTQHELSCAMKLDWSVMEEVLGVVFRACGAAEMRMCAGRMIDEFAEKNGVAWDND
ncbi:hypothetical protein BWQ96_10327 [Gracilariopsis chorda]|uniref:Uncharacterized protein n=1 Tax=Gracilariopsis chorda TaxID=448386 RepID=A0A2V3ID13_9FLOR|nr:hypothetical protein BWQ96_10327 [Gracilariopsis chorda]|eukprot:PXF39976.1 hypothetical protein BWQ96_10327 [Gracilariopsis chorda]